MTLIKTIQNPSPIYSVKELALANLLNTEEGLLMLSIYKSLINYDLDKKIDILYKLERLCKNLPISSLDNPMYTCEYINHGNGVLQSTRLPSLFSNNAGYTWHDLDKKPKDYDFWNKLSITFLYLPFKWFTKTRQYICKRKIYFVSFPYDSAN
jgi:hypothetical protein